VALDRRSTFVHVLFSSSRQSQVPVGDTDVLGSTAHQVSEWNQTLDCGFSPVLKETGTGVSGIDVAVSAAVWLSTSGDCGFSLLSTRTARGASGIDVGMSTPPGPTQGLG